MANTANNTEWDDIPLFAPDDVIIPRLSADQTDESVTSAVSALSHLLYDEETPQEISELLRDEGNRQFKRGVQGCRKAIEKYTKAIEAAKGDQEIIAPALLNRSIAQYKLGNYGYSLKDAEASLELNPNNTKALYRAAICATNLSKYETALRYCSTALKANSSSNPLNATERAQFIRQTSLIEKQLSLQKQRQKDHDLRQQKKQSEDNKILRLYKDHNIQLGYPLFGQQEEYNCIYPKHQNGEWEWPLLLIYPSEILGEEIGDQTDYLESVCETTSVDEILYTVFEQSAPWDINGFYRNVELLEARFRVNWTRIKPENEDNDDDDKMYGSNLPRDEVGEWICIDSTQTLRQVISRKDYIMPLFPVLYVVPKGMKLI